MPSLSYQIIGTIYDHLFVVFTTRDIELARKRSIGIILTGIVNMQLVDNSFVAPTEYNHKILNGNRSMTMPWSWRRPSRIRNLFPF